MHDDLLSLQDVAEILDVPSQAIHRWVRDGVVTPLYVEGEWHFRPHHVRTLFEEQPTGLPEPRKQVLLLEDDFLVAGSLKTLLEKAGFEVVTAAIGLAALDLVAREPFDLIIADIRMPGMNGIEALGAIRELRSQFGGSPIPEVILTAYDDPEVRREAERMGIRDFVLKPFEMDSFLDLIKKRVRRSKIPLKQ